MGVVVPTITSMRAVQCTITGHVEDQIVVLATSGESFVGVVGGVVRLFSQSDPLNPLAISYAPR